MSGPLKDFPFGVVDLHAHPSLKVYLFNHKFWKAHNPPGFMFPPCMRTDLDALLAGGVQGLLSTIYVPEKEIANDARQLRFLRHLHGPTDKFLTEEPDDLARETLNQFRTHIKETRKRRGDVVDFAWSYSEFERLMGEGKVALVQSLEGAHHLNGKLENLDDFFERGVAHMIIPHFYPNAACGCVDPIPKDLPLRKLGMMNYKRDPLGPLTPWGAELVDRMWDLGMIVDMTHATPHCRGQILERARQHPKKRPVIMSHVGVHALAPHAMNPTPEEIRAIADTGGVVGIIFMTFWLQVPEIRKGIDVVLKTIDHLVQHGGEEVVAFGSDFDGFTGVPYDIKSPRDYNLVRSHLLRAYTETQVEKFLKGNAMRVLRDGWGKQ